MCSSCDVCSLGRFFTAALTTSMRRARALTLIRPHCCCCCCYPIKTSSRQHRVALKRQHNHFLIAKQQAKVPVCATNGERFSSRFLISFLVRFNLLLTLFFNVPHDIVINIISIPLLFYVISSEIFFLSFFFSSIISLSSSLNFMCFHVSYLGSCEGLCPHHHPAWRDILIKFRRWTEQHVYKFRIEPKFFFSQKSEKIKVGQIDVNWHASII